MLRWCVGVEDVVVVVPVGADGKAILRRCTWLALVAEVVRRGIFVFVVVILERVTGIADRVVLVTPDLFTGEAI